MDNVGNFFHPVPISPQTDPDGPRTRCFTGDGSPYLKVPGLKRLDKVRIGTMTLPAELTAEIVTSVAGAEVRTAAVSLGPCAMLAADESGGEILMRNRCSNDGSWNQGASVWVVGEWADQAPAAEPGKK